MNNLWRLSVAVTLGLAWYFSDCGRSVIQYLIGFLLCLIISPLFRSNGRESSTQTDKETMEHPLQETVEEVFDVTDGETLQMNKPLISQCPHVKKSLQQVFECAYAQLVLPWYGVPELPEHQPLHRVLSREFDFVIDHIIQRSRDFDVHRAVVGSIRILTQHLHNAKQSDRELLFSSASVEMAVLRELSDALVRNLFPQSFWGQEIHHCALNEIIALKGLGLMVTWLSDPDNLNQLVVNQLDGVALKSSAEEPPVSDPDQASLASQEGDGDGEGSEVRLPSPGVLPDTDIGSKRRGNRLMEGWSKLVDKMKSKKIKKKKMKKREQELVLFRATPACAPSEDDVSFRRGSLLNQDDSEREDSDLEDYLESNEEDLIELKLSYEMWRVGHWTVSIPHADQDDKELVFTVHLEERDNPENLQWDIKKTYMDVIYFRNRWQDTSLPTIFELKKESELNDEVKEEARASVEHFLQELVSDDAYGRSQPVFQFLCPLDKLLNEEEHHGGVWGLVSGLAYFLTPGKEEEENSNPQTEVPKENTAPCPLPESSALTVENSCNSTEGSRDIPGSPLPTIVVSQYNTPPQPAGEAGTNPDPQPAVYLSHENCSRDKSEDSDNPVTSHFKMIIKGLTRTMSLESLCSAKSSGDEEQQLDEMADLEQEDSEELACRSLFSKSNKKEKPCLKMTPAASKTKGKETQGAVQRGDESQRGQGNCEQLEATRAIFDLLKEISGNSIFIKLLKLTMPLFKNTVNNLLNKMNPTEELMAAYVDTLRNKMWPEIQQVPAPPPPRTDEEKKETRERAHYLINSRYSNVLVQKTNVEAVFNIFQNSEENKNLVYMLLLLLFREFLPNEPSLTVSAAFLQKVTGSCSRSVKP